MTKSKTSFVCQVCGSVYPKWYGKCPQCGSWNSIIEEIIVDSSKSSKPSQAASVFSVQDIPSQDNERLTFSYGEINRVLGGGLVRGSFLLLGGEPGIGKSTLLLQVALHHPTLKCLYVSGEESLSQLKMRAERIGIHTTQTFMSNETNTDLIIEAALNQSPDILIIDSIQTVFSSKIDAFIGSPSQIRQCASELQRLAKENHISVFLIGHINKEGLIAGPKLLEHMVDVVLQFEGDEHYGYRILRTLKNRFGPTHELGIFEMYAHGLREINNPSEVLLAHRTMNLSGTAVAATIQGLRPLLIEVQALVSSTAYGNPQRTSTGFDHRRLNMLLAILEKRLNLKMGMQDVFLNITGGLRIDDPALDLGVVCALISSYIDLPIPSHTCFTGEVGLAGEVRPVDRIEQRVAEAARIGFKHIFIPTPNAKSIDKNQFPQLEIIPVDHVKQVWQFLQNLTS